ncbi:MAG: glutamate-5-semialdehyde dehydrogenase [Desulfobacterales bacterium]|nr:MAG: glutamate-5-semialdehyde dehydrogenase [Desulfobacterales bacterium]
MGVIGVIFESRPDALVQIATLCLKSANGVLLKGGSEAASTNQILARIVHDACVEHNAPKGWLGLLETRDDVEELLKMEKDVDLLIPRGSNAFVQYIMKHTLIPVLGHADGICHLYIDKEADPAMAVKLAVDSKCQYVAVCNAVETILIHKDAAKSILPELARELASRGVKMMGCPATCAVIDIMPASQEDWQTEYLDYMVSIRTVDSMDAAISHINTYGSGHTDVIVTKNRQRAESFMNMTDTADAFWNCSSRFADGYRFGLGAEVGISTNKLHARGPVGLEGLMTFQWRLAGNGQCVADYVLPGTRSFSHIPLNKQFLSQ